MLSKNIIIGGGISGLAIASKLIKSGLKNVRILEASDRLGGRIYSHQFNGKHDIELGAQWIHGEQGNVAFEIAKRMNIIDNPSMEHLDTIFVDEFGNRIDGKKLQDCWKEIDKLIEGTSHETNITYSVKDYIESYSAKFFERNANERDLHMALDYVTRANLIMSGAPCFSDLSLVGSCQVYETLPGCNKVTFKSEHNFSDIASHFLNDIPPKNIDLQSKVTKIRKTASDIEILVNDNKSISADYVVFTGSLGVLKSEAEILFEPKLPSEKLTAIRTLGMGNITKIFLEFENIWWPLDYNGFSTLYDNKVNYASPDLDMSRAIWGIFRVLHKENVLSIWVVGEASKQIEKLDDDQIQTKVMEHIRKNYQKIFPNISDPTAILVSRWFTNPLTRGTYSFITPNALKSGIEPNILATPLWGNRLLFAGEATHSTHFSTVHGAIQSGWREAERIITMSR